MRYSMGKAEIISLPHSPASNVQGAAVPVAGGFPDPEIALEADEIVAADRFELPNRAPVREYVYVRITPTTVMGRSFERRVRPQA